MTLARNPKNIARFERLAPSTTNETRQDHKQRRVRVRQSILFGILDAIRSEPGEQFDHPGKPVLFQPRADRQQGLPKLKVSTGESVRRYTRPPRKFDPRRPVL